MEFSSARPTGREGGWHIQFDFKGVTFSSLNSACQRSEWAQDLPRRRLAERAEPSPRSSFLDFFCFQHKNKTQTNPFIFVKRVEQSKNSAFRMFFLR